VITGLDRPELATLWSAARAHLERRSLRVEGARVTLRGLDDDEIAAVCSLVGRRRPTSSTVRVDLAQLDAKLRAGPHGVGVIDVLVAIGGPMRDRRGERVEAARGRDELWSLVVDHPATQDERVARWVESLRMRGRLTRLGITAPDVAVTDALDVVGALVERAEGGARVVPLAVLAAELTGDAHGLDDDRAVGQLIADAVVALSGELALRQAWATFAVDIDAVNSSVLTLGLAGPPGSILDVARRSGEPLRLTTRMLRTIEFDDELADGGVVHVCENPSIVAAAADSLGAASGPLVCTDGMPKHVTGVLLSLLADGGAAIRAHADFDVGGIAVVSHLRAVHGVAPWRFGRRDYLDALARPTRPLDGTVGSTPWDESLAATMNDTGRAIHEEALLDTLLADLHRPAGRA
jgi:uncharacterized protein (TIGR02679 family)